jgi:anaerobic ribonucleoside-triphosphate reductase activating protein
VADTDSHIRIASILAESRVNGPGRRSVVHVQGCTLDCPACFNPHTHASDKGQLVTIAEVVDRLLVHNVDGVTISGGEPFQQPDALMRLVQRLREKAVASILIFTGFSYEEVVALPLGCSILEEVDVLIAGRYEATQPTGGGLLSSMNQRAHLLSEYYTLDDLKLGGNLEITIAPDGVVHLTGFPPPDVRRLVRRLGD